MIDFDIHVQQKVKDCLSIDIDLNRNAQFNELKRDLNSDEMVPLIGLNNVIIKCMTRKSATLLSLIIEETEFESDRCYQ